MITYLSRPVFTLPVNWAASPSLDFSYDLRERQLGYAAPRFEKLQTATRHGFSGKLSLPDEATIVEFEEFGDACAGRLRGFWIPHPMAVMKIEPDVTGTMSFLVKDARLREWWEDHPSRYMVFQKPGKDPMFGKIDAVEATVDGRELVTLAGAVGDTIDETWDVSKLLYCRFASDDEELEYVADNNANASIKVIELTEEYGEIEAGLRKVFLYEFEMTIGPQSTIGRLTGLNQDIVSQGDTWQTAPIEHTELIRTMKATTDTLTVKTWFEEGNPLQLCFPFEAPGPITLRVYETSFELPDTRTQIYEGELTGAGLKGLEITATFGRKFLEHPCPGFYIGPFCNHRVYDDFCQAPLSEFTATGTIHTINVGSRVIEVNLSDPPLTGKSASKDMNYWALGWLETGEDPNFEIAAIRQSSAWVIGRVVLRMDKPLKYAVVGQVIKIIAGCDQSRDMCKKKFRRWRNFGGLTVPQENSSTDPLYDQIDSSKK